MRATRAFRLVRWTLPVALLLALGLPSWAGFTTVSDFFRQGRYQEARQALAAGGQGARPGEDLLWESRLAGSVEQAVSILSRGRDDLPLPVRQRMALELAEIHFARQDHAACLGVLEPIIEESGQDLPGEAYLLAGLSCRLLGRMQKAREMLASVKPADPVFAEARYHLGDIGLQQGDQALALRYFQSGRGQDRPPHPALEAGKWRALRAEGDTRGAARVREDLESRFPSSLALLDVRRIMREEAEELAARAVTAAPADTTLTPPVTSSGRYSLQIGAFSDRALALEFLRRFREQLPDLRIDQERDDRGQFLYKVRSGAFVNPALARTEAARLQRSLGIDVIVADLSGTRLYSE